MKNFFKISAFAILGGVMGGITRLITYQIYKGTIEFDGPALLSFWLAIFGGFIVFGLIGTVLIAKKKF